MVVGGNGHLGGAFTELVERRGHETVVWDLPDNVLDIDQSHISAAMPALVVNFSFSANLQASGLNVNTEDFSVNVLGVQRIIEAVRPFDIPFIQISTREVIGMRDFRLHRSSQHFSSGDHDNVYRVPETESCMPLNSYGMAKLTAEFLCRSYERSAVVRLNTPYIQDWRRTKGLIGTLLDRARNAGHVSLANGGTALRDPLHIDDLTSLLLRIHECDAFGEVYHAAGGEDNVLSLRDICFLANPNVRIENGPESQDFGFVFAIEKAAQLGWEPKISVRQWLATLD